MNIESVILGFLMDEPMSGYDIKRKFEMSVSNFFEATFSGIYPALRKMESAGLITKEVVIQQGKPNKNVFTITEAGKEAFFAYLESPSRATVVHSDFLIRFFFGKHASKEQLQRWILDERNRIEENYRKLLETKESVYEYLTPFEALTLDYGIAHTAFSLEWLQRLARESGIEV
ncbi:PadR family transcriptional regulator [Alicyclobacillus shizuokensis]|uniref:PadR family transcriptional regulator n=1 Tax=Alicyclobacillus shizuokensis TaxID=392014 RepID=UPI00082B7F95|nr:PadR family transcriptional regulator [Alicyclobacillus shizuokensis]MCL6625316.1 PadR family transcriptional regulator [Alicyclobacillus shizuokensis]